MTRAGLQPGWSFVLVGLLLLGVGRLLLAATGEENLLVLKNGGMICGIAPQIGGRIMVFRRENGGNVLDARPELWKDVAVTDLLTMDFKQYYGESVWAGPQDVWWSEQETYPPSVHPHGFIPPDPAWELAAFTVVEQAPARVVLRSPVSKLSGLELTKTIELGADGQLKIHETAVNRSDKVVTRDLWLLHRVNTKAPSFLPLKSVSSVNRGFWIAGDVQKFGQITMVQLRPGVTDWGSAAQGKMKAVADAGWMASVVPDGFFVVRFQATDEKKTALDQGPVEVYVSSEPEPLVELEHHGEFKTLKPGDAMESEETWQIVPYTASVDPGARAEFLQKEESPEPVVPNAPTLK